MTLSVSARNNYLIFLNISFLLLASVFLIMHLFSSEYLVFIKYHRVNSTSQQGCKDLHTLDDYKAKCSYLKSHDSCVSRSYIDYLYLFNCKLGSLPLLGYTLLILWILVLFYLLGNTASEYFCSSLESLSSLLKLSPTIAGVTLLSLGNGAPDIFAIIVSFMGNGTGGIGLNSVLGAASFVTCVVVGIMSISMHKKQIRVNRYAFIRDACFFLLVLGCLIVILIKGKIHLWGAIAFFSLYIVYVMMVWNTAGEDSERHGNLSNDSDSTPILNGMENGEDFRISEEGAGEDSERHGNTSNDCDSIPILNGMENGEEFRIPEEGTVEGESLVESKKSCFCWRSLAFCGTFLSILEMPLYLPRRLTIPVICEERWSKPYAVASVTLAPLLLSALWNFHEEKDAFNTSLIAYGVALVFGIALGVLALLTTEKSSPPKRCTFPWLAGGFLMSITWSYITAKELVGLLLSMGYIWGLNPSILAVTVLAWGNSLGDLTTNLTMAMKGGAKGAQIAISGCYAGPILNTLFGLGLSFLGSSWSNFPSPVVIPRDPYLLETLGFLAAGLLWALVALPRRDMKLDGVLGGGLLVVYTVSVSSRLIQAHR